MKKFQLKKPDIKGKIRKIRNLKKEDVIAYWKGRHERRERILEARRNSAFAKKMQPVYAFMNRFSLIFHALLACIINFTIEAISRHSHIALHLDGNEVWYLDDFDVQGADEIEKQADAMAQEALIPSSVWKNNMPISTQDVRELAKELQISPCIVAGRLRFESGDHKKFGALFRDKISHHFSL